MKGSEAWTTTPNTGSGVGKDKGSGPLKNPLYHQFAKFKAAAPSSQRIQEVLQEAQEYGLLSTDQWNVAQVARNPTHAPPPTGGDTTPQPDAESATQSVSVLETVGETPAPVPPAKGGTDVNEASGTATDAAPAASAVPASGETKPAPKDHNQILALAAWHNGKKDDETDLSMVLHYKLQWCQLASESTNGNRVSEPVMRIPFGPVPVSLGQSNAHYPPKSEEDYFAKEFATG